MLFDSLPLPLAVPRLRNFFASLALTMFLAGFTLLFLYMGQVRLFHDSSRIFLEHIHQISETQMGMIEDNFLRSSRLVQSVRARDLPVLHRIDEDFRIRYSGAALILSKDGETVFSRGGGPDPGPEMDGRLLGTENLQVGKRETLRDDSGSVIPGLEAVYWINIPHVFQHLESLAQGARLTTFPARNSLKVFDEVWITPPGPAFTLCSIFKTPAYFALLGFQSVVVFLCALLGFSHFYQREGRSHRITSLAGVLEEKDPYTLGHSDRVADFAEMIARAMGIRGAKLRRLRLAARVHDIGKIFVPSKVLNKPGRLNDEEWGIIRRHSVDSERIFKKLLPDQEVASVIRSHHERWDGKGYPDGLRGKNIPLGARIIAVADTFDAMTSKRSYRDAMAELHAFQVIEENAGSQFDPDVARVAVTLFRNIHRDQKGGQVIKERLQGRLVRVSTF